MDFWYISNMLARHLFALLFLFSTGGFAQFYYGSQMDFGKNRVQFGLPHYWTWYRFEKYDVYFYKGGREIGEYVATSARKHIPEIEKLLDFSLDSRIEFMVYNKQSEYKQSNLGLITDEQYNVGGVTRIVGSKVAVYFDGDHKHLETQIRSGAAQVLINQMMYGGNVKEMVKNSTFLTLPDWYTEGLVSYISNPYDIEVENRVKDGILSGKFSRFNHLTGADAHAAGHSLWGFVAATYGENVISNILYMTKLSRNVENAFLFVLGVSVKNVAQDWNDYYKTRYGKNDADRKLPNGTPILTKPKQSRVYSQAKVSPDGKKVAYVTNEMGQYKVFIYNSETKKHKRILKREKKVDRINDYSFPLLAWHPTGEILAIITEYKGELLMTYYTLSSGKKDAIKMVNFEKILDLSYSPDGRKIVLSAINKGQSDIYVFSIAGGAIEQITNDVYDDLNPRWMKGGKKIIFSSNRISDTLRPKMTPKGNVSFYKDLFIYNYAQKSPVLKRVTSTPYINETEPFEYDSTAICFLADENGVRNRFVATFDSALAYVDTAEHYRYITKTMAITNYSRNIITQDFNSPSGKFAQIIFSDGYYRIFVEDRTAFSALVPIDLTNTAFADQIKKNQPQSDKHGPNVSVKVKSGDKENFNPNRDSTLININNYTFDNEKLREKKEEKKFESVKQPPLINPVKKDSSTGLSNIDFGQMRNYNRFFTANNVITQLDNNYLSPIYQKFSGGTSPIWIDPGFSALFKIELTDLFEDYKITGGARLPSNLNSNEFFLSYEDRMRRWDKQYILHRQSLLDVVQGAFLIKIHTHQGKYVLKYPFSEVASIRGTFTARYDRTVYLALENVSLQKPNLNEYWGAFKLEYVFDNTIRRGLNLYNGLRFKLFAETFSQVNKAETDMTVVGCDFRFYKKIHREFIWANRLAASTALGNQKLLYYMGGVDGWLAPRFNTSIPISTKENYVYQTLATPMRGFEQNIRNGNSFVLLNSELRMPIFRYLFNRPIKSDFLHNFQVVGFGDVGTAWNGPDPYSDQNALNTLTIGGPPVFVILKNQREPIVGGYGFGLRSRVLGYFVRADWAWGVDDGIVQDRVFYLSLSLDF
jgi:hypothetical protein